MISDEQAEQIDQYVTFHIMGLIELHEVNARGVYNGKMSKRTLESWKAILDCIHTFLDPSLDTFLTQEEYTKILQLVINHTSTAGTVATLQEKKKIAYEEDVGKSLKEKIEDQLDKAIDERNSAYEEYQNYLNSITKS